MKKESQNSIVRFLKKVEKTYNELPPTDQKKMLLDIMFIWISFWAAVLAGLDLSFNGPLHYRAIRLAATEVCSPQEMACYMMAVWLLLEKIGVDIAALLVLVPGELFLINQVTTKFIKKKQKSRP